MSSIFNFNGTLISGLFTPNDSSIQINEDFHIINATLGNFNIFDNTHTPSHGIVFCGGYGECYDELDADWYLYSDYLQQNSIFNIYDCSCSEVVFYIDKTTGDLNIWGSLTAGGYGNLPKWISGLYKAGANVLGINWSDGTTSTLPVVITKNIDALIMSVTQNSLASIRLRADDVPYNGAITITGSIDGDDRFDISWPATDDNWIEGYAYSFSASSPADTPDNHVHVSVYNSNGTYIGGASCTRSYVAIRVGSVITITNGVITNIKY